VPPRIWVYDPGNRRFSLWAIGQPGAYELLRNFRVNLEGVFHRPFLTADGMIFTRDWGEALLYLADSAGRVRRTVGDLPYPTTEYLYDATVNFPLPVADPARRRLALPYMRTNRVDFYEVTGRYIATSAAPVDVPPLRTARIDGQRRYERPLPVTYGRGAATARFVYLTYCGCTTAQQPQIYRYVHVYDWEGMFITSLDLGAPSWAIEVSADDDVLYAVIEDLYPLIVTFGLPPQLHSSGVP
jgi:hypothetical protein